MRLLSEEQLTAIKSVIKDVTDTFHRTPITIHTKSAEVWDGEDDTRLPDRPSYSVLCRLLYGTNTSDSARNDDTGAIDRNRIIFTVDKRNLEEVDFPLATDGLPLVEVSNTYIEYNSRYYNLINYSTSGAFDEEQLLVKFECDIEKYHTSLANF